MSEVISFRLNKDNCREAKALIILQEWRTNGYSVRQTITEALVSLERDGLRTTATIEELNEALSQANHLLRLIEIGGYSTIDDKKKSHSTNSLSTNFISSVKRAAKSGLKLD
jgi:hypothetical protein